MSRRYRRNPTPFNLDSFLTGAAMPAAIGAAGAIGVDFLMANLPLPANLRTGTALPIVQIAMALLAGTVVGMATSNSYGEAVAAGAMTVILYNTAKPFLQAQVPQVTLSRYMPLGRYLGRRRRFRLAPGGYTGGPARVRRLGGGQSTPMQVARPAARPGRSLGYIGPARTATFRGLGRYALS